MKIKSFSIDLNEADIEKEFQIIKTILAKDWQGNRHQNFIKHFGQNYRTIAFHIIDNASGVFAQQREELLRFFYINQFTEGDDGTGMEEFAFDDSEIVEKCIQKVADKDYVELLNRVNIKNGRTKLKELYGIDLKDSNEENVQVIHDKTIPQSSFVNLLELTTCLNHWTAKDNAKDAQEHILALLNIKIEENERHWLALELSRRNYLFKSISSGIEGDLGYISHIHDWDLCIDDEIKTVIESIDTKVLSFIRYHTTATSDQLKKIQLKADYLGINVAIEELKKIIMENDIQDSEYFLQMVNWYVLCEEITEAAVWIEYAQKLKEIPLNIHFEFMMFYMRFDHGYHRIAQYAARILPRLNKEERRSLVPFLLKQIEVGYLNKADLSSAVIAEIVLYQNELN